MSYDDGRRGSGGITVDIKFKKIIFIKEFDSFPYRGKTILEEIYENTNSGKK